MKTTLLIFTWSYMVTFFFQLYFPGNIFNAASLINKVVNETHCSLILPLVLCHANQVKQFLPGVIYDEVANLRTKNYLLQLLLNRHME